MDRRRRSRSIDRVKVTLAIGLVLIFAAIGLTLTQGPMSLARRSTDEDSVLGANHRKTVICQADEVLPRGTTAIRPHLDAEYGPRVAVTVLERGRVIASGHQEPGWTGGAVTVPVGALARTASGVKVCLALSLNGEETV